jgi:hypothetical protein
MEDEGGMVMFIISKYEGYLDVIMCGSGGEYWHKYRYR